MFARLNGIFGNTDLIVTYLASINEIIESEEKKRDNKKESPTLAPTPGKSPPKSPSLTAISSFQEVKDKSDTGLLKYMLDQVMQSTESIQKCAEHQKCMTDDVLHLSRLRSHKLIISNSFYRPYETIMNVVGIFRQQADNKVKLILTNKQVMIDD